MEKKTKLTDEELKNVNGGVKIVLFKNPRFLKPILDLIFKIKKRSNSPKTPNAQAMSDNIDSTDE